MSRFFSYASFQRVTGANPKLTPHDLPADSGGWTVAVKQEDIALIARAREGDERAYRTLLQKYERAVFSICLRMVRNRDLAADLSQDSFIKVFSMLERYNPSYTFSSWLFKITSNLR